MPQAPAAGRRRAPGGWCPDRAERDSGRPEKRRSRPFLRRHRQTAADVFRRPGNRPDPVSASPQAINGIRHGVVRVPAGHGCRPRPGIRVRHPFGPADRLGVRVAHPARLPDRTEAGAGSQRGGDRDDRGHDLHRHRGPPGRGRLHSDLHDRVLAGVIRHSDPRIGDLYSRRLDRPEPGGPFPDGTGSTRRRKVKCWSCC